MSKSTRKETELLSRRCFLSSDKSDQATLCSNVTIVEWDEHDSEVDGSLTITDGSNSVYLGTYTSFGDVECKTSKEEIAKLERLVVELELFIKTFKQGLEKIDE